MTCPLSSHVEAFYFINNMLDKQKEVVWWVGINSGPGDQGLRLELFSWNFTILVAILDTFLLNHSWLFSLG